MNRPGRHRLSIDVPLPIYRRIRMVCKKRSITMTKLIVRSLLMQLYEEEKYEKPQDD